MPLLFFKKHPVLAQVIFLFLLSLPGNLRADLTITINTNQDGGTLTVSPVGALRISSANDPILTMTNGAIGNYASGLEAVVVGGFNGGTGRLLINGGSVLSTVDAPGGTIDSELLNRGTGAIGRYVGSIGVVTVSGSGSIWANRGYLYVGDQGSGTLNITNGGQVSQILNYSNFGATSIGSGASGTGRVNVSGAGSTWNTTGSLSVGASGNGSLTINGAGQVISQGFASIGVSGKGTVGVSGAGSAWSLTSRLDLYHGTLSVTNGGQVINGGASIGNNNRGQSLVAVDGAGSKWTTSLLRVSGTGVGSGRLNVTNGGEVKSFGGSIGYLVGASGTALIRNSTWDLGNQNFYIGESGTGNLSLTQGGQVISGFTSIGHNAGANGLASVDASTWSISNNLVVGRAGGGNLNIKNGGSVTNASGFVGQILGSTGEVTVEGENSLWSSSDLYIGGSTIGAGGTGILNIANEGKAEVSGALQVWQTGQLNINISGNHMLEVGGNLINHGTTRFTAGPGLAVGTYSPVSVGGIWAGTGNVQAIGGSWDQAGLLFSVSAPVNALDGEQVNVDLNVNQRVEISNGSQQVAVSFGSVEETIQFSASFNSIDSIAAREVFAAWDFTTDMPLGSLTLVSMEIGPVPSSSFAVWHSINDGLTWTLHTTDVFYAEGVASFYVSGFSSYAITASTVPEPSSLILLLLGAVGLLLRNRSKHQSDTI